LEKNAELQINGQKTIDFDSNETYFITDLNIKETQVIKNGEKMRKEPAYVDN
jgi:hypothetical protein